MPTMEEIRTALGNMDKSSEKPLIETSNILFSGASPRKIDCIALFSLTLSLLLAIITPKNLINLIFD